MASATLNMVTTYDVEYCCRCGIAWAMTRDFRNARINDHGWFYCPSGHQQHYTGKTDAQKAQEQARQAEEANERLRRQLRGREQDLQAARRSHAATKGQLTKTKRRIAHGVCPCCTRSFANVERHMANKHPEFVDEAKG